jgi:two-component system response regulator AtoC
MIPVNCGGIPETLLESELFGHTRGAFTGADKNRKGLFEEADGGTLFLDEIGELPLPLQVKLLRALQEGEVRPLGSSKTRILDVRVIAATSKHLKREARLGRFREDLLYRLDVFRIQVPPLQERGEDIPLLCNHFIRGLGKKYATSATGVAPAAMKRLLDYGWPGNVRELENTLERAVVLAEGPLIQVDDLAEFFGDNPSDEDMPGRELTIGGYSIKKAMRAVERHLIAKALKATNGNRTHAGRLLEISHPSLLAKMKAYDIDG